MGVDRIISESLGDKAAELKIGNYRYEEMLQSIEKRVEERKKNILLRCYNRIVNSFASLRLKDLIEVAAVILILITVPAIARGLKNMPWRESGRISGNPNNRISTIEPIYPESISIDKAIAAGSVTIKMNNTRDVLYEIHHIEKLDEFIEKFHNNEKYIIRIEIYREDFVGGAIDAIYDLYCDKGQIEIIDYNVFSDKTLFRPLTVSYYTGIKKTEEKGGIAVYLKSKPEDGEDKWVKLINLKSAKMDEAELQAFRERLFIELINEDLSVYPKFTATSGNTVIDWVRGDAFFSSDPVVILGNTNWGADKHVAKLLKGNAVEANSIVNLKAEEFEWYNKPQYEVAMYDGETLIPYKSKNNQFNAPKVSGEYLFSVTVSWGYERDMVYWFKLIVP